MKQSVSNTTRSLPDWELLDQKKSSWLYKIIRWFVWLFSPKYTIVGAENLPQEPCVIVGNHNAYQDFWSGKPRALLWFYKILSHLITPLALLIFNNAHTIAVYHDTRLISTFRDSIEKLREGNSIVIFPECYDEHNNIVHGFQEKFVDLARFYYKKTGIALRFVPLYLAPSLKKLFYAEPIAFHPDAPIEQERERICNALMDAITEIALAQPPHTVVPYPNVSKKHYPKSKSSEDTRA